MSYILLIIVNNIEHYSGHAQVWSSTHTSARLIFLSLLCKNGPEQCKQRANLARGRVNTGQTSFSHWDSHLPLPELQPSSGRGRRILSLRQQKPKWDGDRLMLLVILLLYYCSVAKVKQTWECSVDLFDASASGGFGVCVILSNRKWSVPAWQGGCWRRWSTGHQDCGKWRQPWRLCLYGPLSSYMGGLGSHGGGDLYSTNRLLKQEVMDECHMCHPLLKGPMLATLQQPQEQLTNTVNVGWWSWIPKKQSYEGHFSVYVSLGLVLVPLRPA